MLVTHLVRLTKLEIQHIMLVIIRSVIFPLSFHPTKLITTGEGGALLTNDKRIKDKANMLINHGYETKKLKREIYLNYYKIKNLGTTSE